MSQPVIIKVYGNLWPVNTAEYQELKDVAEKALPSDGIKILLEKDLLKISFEGIYFPVDDAVNIFKKNLNKLQKGKLDIIDMEMWKLERYTIEDNSIHSHSASLNNILDYSGH